MELNEMNLMEVEERLNALETEVRESQDVDFVEKATEEKKALLERKAELVAIEERMAQAEALQNEEVEADKIVEERKEMEPVMEERKVFGIDTVEYRNAFFANLVGQATEEQRSILADNSAYGDGLALPVGTDSAIWDQVSKAHPILADVAKINSGIAIKVTKMTPAPITKKKDSDPSAQQTMTGVDVTLVGADYHTYVELSYAEAKMSQGAMEQFLVNEIANALGEALAKDIFTQIETDAAANSVTATSDIFADVKSALGKAVQATRPVIYAPADKYYEIVGAIKSGSPFNIGATLGCEVKLDTAAAHVTIVDPSMFVLNEVQAVTMESERDAKNACYVIAGYMRAEGCLRKTAAAAFIA